MAAKGRNGTPAGSMRASGSSAPASPIDSKAVGPITPITPSVKSKSYRSEGVRDNDIFLLPGSDYQVLGLLTAIGAIVRLFRIYQPTSVVFDEVQ